MEENKNQDPEEEKKSSNNDDDFGLPDFEFEALDDDDDDFGGSGSDNSEGNQAAKKELFGEDEDMFSSKAEDVPSMDVDDLEGLDLEGMEDLDLSDLGDLGDINLDDLDLDDLDLDDLDKDLIDLDETIRDTEVPTAATAEKIEDIFNPLTGQKDGSSDSTEEVELEDDGLFYEEESYSDFDMGDMSSDTSAIFEKNSESDSEEFDSSMFESDDMLSMDIEDSGGEMQEEAIPFAKRPYDKEYRHDQDEDHGPIISDSEIKKSRGKFVRIVVLGTILFVGAGFIFLYLSKSIDFEGKDSAIASKVEKEPVKETVEKSKADNEEPSEEAATNVKPEAEKDQAKQPAKETPKPAKEQAKQPVKEQTKQPAKETPKVNKVVPKTNTTKPAATNNKPPAQRATTGGTTLNQKTGQRHLIVASFLDSQSAEDHVKKLMANGEKPSIIPPFDGAPNYRVAIASYSTLNEALQNLEGYRLKFGSGVWVLRY